ncbi:hypothetical protein Ae150APs1_2765 [Pseudonocardia sp. Ae150A_Ps1]|nr:hypothetical protein Ae150APs1_2765 [Pseudonocardia sp. Ae150A_Ps1]
MSGGGGGHDVVLLDGARQSDLRHILVLEQAGANTPSGEGYDDSLRPARLPDSATRVAPRRAPRAARCSGFGDGSGHGPTGTSTRSAGANPAG